MLRSADVIPFLLHGDADVREHALEHLANGHDPAPATADDVWAAMDRYGDVPTRSGANERVRFASKLAHFPPTPQSTERLFQALRAGVTPEVGAHHLVRAARELPLSAVRALVADEAIRARLSPAMMAEIEDDIRLAETSFDALWTALSSAAVELGESWTLASPVYPRALRVVRAIARHPEQAAARGLEVLSGQRPRAAVEANMELLAVEIFDRVRYPGPLAPLLRILGEDGDYANERAADALVRVGTPEVVAALAARLPGTDAFFDYAPGAIARIRRPESEALLLRLLEAETDLYRRTDLAMYLLDLCPTSAEALGIVEEMVEEGEYDPLLVDLDELLVTAGEMVGWSPRDPEAWDAKPKLVRSTLPEALGLSMERTGPACRHWQAARIRALWKEGQEEEGQGEALARRLVASAPGARAPDRRSPEIT